MAARGRPSKEFDLAEVEKLGMLGATMPEIAAWFDCGIRTVERRMSDHEGDFRRAFEKGYGRLKISLRRKQVEVANGGNVSMLIWLGKQMLGQADKQQVKEDATITQRVEGVLALTPEDEEFLKRKAELL